MDRLFFSIWAVIACLQGVHSAQWSASFPDGAIVHACGGDAKVTFPWAITLGSEEEIASSEWFYHARSEEMIAFFTHGNFVSMPTFSQRVEQLDSLGLTLSHITQGDAGNYSVEVIVRNRTSGTSYTLRHSAVLVVYSESEAVRDATVSVIQEPVAVYSNGTGQYHVQLFCSGQGRQPPAVIWTLPLGETRVVSTAENGHFPLLVPNPVSGGNYTCRVHDDSPAATCLPSNSPALQGRSLYLDALTARLTLIEAGQQQLRAENSQQQTEIAQMKTENSQQQTEIAQLKAENSQLRTENNQLKNRLDQHLHDMASKRVAFHARFSTSTQVSYDHPLVLNQVLYNQGNGYSPSTGIFTAPHGGTYAFLVTTLPYRSTDYVTVQIMQNSTVLNQMNGYVTGEAQSCNAVVHLSAGQTVWVASWGSWYFRYDGTAFSGFLVSPDP